jgi:hypothetical protein
MPNLSSPLIALIVVAAVIFVIVRQFLPRRLSDGRAWVVPLILFALGLSGLNGSDLTATAGPLAISAAVAIGTGILRAMSFRLWLDGQGRAWAQGTLVTLGLWILLLAARVGLTVAFGAVDPTASAHLASELPLIAGLTLGVQFLVLWWRGRALTAVPESPGSDPDRRQPIA